MAFIRTVPPQEAQGRLKQIYEAALERAGYVAQVLQIMSLDPAVLAGSVGLYVNLMHRPGRLTRAQKELLAVVVSRTNNCYY